MSYFMIFRFAGFDIAINEAWIFWIIINIKGAQI